MHILAREVLLYNLSNPGWEENRPVKFLSRRSIVYGASGMVATSQSLAAQAGLAVLREGGNAVDAAIATAAALTVVEPCSNGLGGDAFAIIWYKGKLYGINASGRSPRLLDRRTVCAQGYTAMPEFGALPVTVPGIPGMWAALQSRFGSRPLQRLLQDAIAYADGGFPVSPVVSKLWGAAAAKYAKIRSEPGIEEWFRVFTRDGRTPAAGEIFRLPDHARTLEQIARTNSEDFYRGELASRIADHFRKLGGYLREDDLAAFHPEWVRPISTRYRGRDIWELPPNGQGIAALIALNILKPYSFRDRDAARTLHLQWEAMKLAFADAARYVADPDCRPIPVEELLSEEHAAKRRRQIGDAAGVPVLSPDGGSNTVYLCSADRDGNMVSYIQSNYSGFGSGIVVPGLGIAMQNRGACFTLEEGHYNCLAGGKRPYHTIIPGFITQGDEPLGPFGMMGGFMQPQGHVQMVMNMFDFGLDIQQTLDVPRWQWEKDKRFWVEPAYDRQPLDELAHMGHEITVSDAHEKFGRGQIIFRTGHGSYMGATEPRADGAAAAY